MTRRTPTTTSTTPSAARRPGPPETGTRRRRVAVLGLGAMGLPMAVRLAHHVDVAGFDPLDSSTDRAQAAGVATAATPAKACAGAEIVVVAVRTLPDVETALFGPGGAVDALDPGAVVVLTSTVGTPGAQDVAARCAGRDVRLLDAPVSGGPLRAASGDLLVLLGGDGETVAGARDVVDLLASTVVVVGDRPGDGQAMKAVNQLLCGVHIAAAAEALALAQGLGIDPAAALDALGAGAASSFMLANRGPRIVEVLAGGSPEVLSRLDIFVKDMGIVAQAGREAGVALPVASAAEQLYRLGEAAGLASSDDSSVVRLLHGSEVAMSPWRPEPRS